MTRGEELQAPCLAAPHPPKDTPWTLSRSDTGPCLSREPSGPFQRSLVKRGLHSLVASLSSFVDYGETMAWLQKKIKDFACFKLAPVATVCTTPVPAPHPPAHHPFPLYAAQTTDSKCAASLFFLRPGKHPPTWPAPPWFSGF